MIDGIKTGNINIPIQIDLDWHVSVNEKTGEVKTVKIAEYRGLVFIEKGIRTYIKGSLHKYFNNGAHNYSDFTFNDLTEVITDFQNRFGIDPETTQLENVEFGVNIELPFRTDRILNSIVLHRGEPFKRFTQGNGIECNHSQYFIKIYDKGSQYKLKNNLLRVEVKVIKMAYFQSQGVNIKTLNDLLNTENLQGMGELLTRTVKEIVYTDTKLLNSSKLNDSERLTLANGSNPNYWNALKPNSIQYPLGNNDPEYKRKRKCFYRELARFEKILCKYDSDIRNTISTKVRDKFTDLLELDQLSQSKKREYKFTNPNTTTGTNLPLVYSVSLSQPSETDSPEKKYCIVTGLDISMQKTGSKFLSIAGLKFYYSREPETYKELERRLSDRWKHEPIEIRFREIAHYIRNESNNPRHNYTRCTTKRGAKLFDDTPYYSQRLKNSMYGKVC